MKTRILKLTDRQTNKVWFLPQHEVAAGVWLEFVGYDNDSPYLHARMFPSLEEAREFLTQPSIYKVGVNGPGLYAEVAE